jgi:hypothetical protein
MMLSGWWSIFLDADRNSTVLERRRDFIAGVVGEKGTDFGNIGIGDPAS